MIRNPQNLKQVVFTEFIKLDEAGTNWFFLCYMNYLTKGISWL